MCAKANAVQESKRGGGLKVWLADGKTFISGRAVSVTVGKINCGT
jgi:hypothetical protein